MSQRMNGFEDSKPKDPDFESDRSEVEEDGDFDPVATARELRRKRRNF